MKVRLFYGSKVFPLGHLPKGTICTADEDKAVRYARDGYVVMVEPKEEETEILDWQRDSTEYKLLQPQEPVKVRTVGWAEPEAGVIRSRRY